MHRVQILRIKKGVDRRSDPIDLGEGSDAEQPDAHAEKGEDFRKPGPFLPHSVFDVSTACRRVPWRCHHRRR